MNSPQRRRRLLFLIADTGGGHRASANAVARQLGTDFPGQFDPVIVDPFTSAAPRLMGRTAGLYGPLIQHARWVWGALYHSTNSRAAVSAMRRTALRPLVPALRRLISDVLPDVVVSFHPLLNHAAVASRGGAPTPPIVTVITDLVDVHAAWACPDVDAMVVPSPGGVDRCRRAGIPASRLFQFGLPVDERFSANLRDNDQPQQLRRRMGLDPDRFTVLLCGGADGSGQIDRRARALARSALDIQLVVVCGRNRRAVQRLRGLQDSRGRPVTVLGFVSTMPQLMRAADLVVSKAGPGTIAEALCSGVPILLTWYLPGQEHGNIDWVVDTNCGRWVPKLGGMIDTVAELSEPDSPTYAAMRRAVRAAARPDATRRIAQLIVDIAGSATAPV